jgi:hypothetical protein
MPTDRAFSVGSAAFGAQGVWLAAAGQRVGRQLAAG